MIWQRDVKILNDIKAGAEVIKKNRTLSYYNLSVSFDIETSSFYDGTEKRACMYVWAMCIDGYYFTGRTWDEWLNLINEIVNVFELNDTLRLCIYVHNLSYELGWILHYFTFTDVMANKRLKPIKCVCDNGIEFRCSYLLSGYSLNTLANVYLSGRVKKLVGTVDYSLIRHTQSRLTRTDYQYIYNDVRIVYEYIKMKIEQDGDITKIPNTKTGYVRKLLKQNCVGDRGVRNRYRQSANNKRYRLLIKTLTIGSVDEYKQMQRAFQGGFTHCSSINQGKVFNVGHYDFTSSYPTCLVAYQYPVSAGHKVKVKTQKEFDRYCKGYCCIFDVHFIGLRPRIIYENYLSSSKCVYNPSDTIINNGRIVESDDLFTTITNVDFEIIKQCYEWDKIEWSNFYIYIKGYLPKPYVETILDLYEKKTMLKGVSGRETEYQSAKENINSLYGATVTSIIHDRYAITDGTWETTTPDINIELEKYNNQYNRVLFFPWGIFCTAWARYNLFFGGIFKFGKDYVYSDTDSVFVRNYDTPEHLKAIQDYNEYITDLLKKACDFHHIPYDKLAPKTIKGVPKPLGVWDFEGQANFKALRAKCYMTETSGHFQMTVSGLAKDKAVKYLHKKYGNDLFKCFTDDMYIPKGHTGKQTHTYIEDTIEGDVTDYQGVDGHYFERSAIHLENSDYSLDLDDDYILYLLGVETYGEY